MSSQLKLEKARQSETPENRAVVPLIPPTIDVNLTNIQGDVYPTFAKKYEGFIFWTIKDAKAFRTCLGDFRKSITTSAQAIEILKQIQRVRLANIENEASARADVDNQFNIGLSRAAFDVLGIRGNIGDDDFMKGSMLKGAKKLGDIPAPDSTDEKYIPAWDNHWMDPENPIHGVIVVASQDPVSYAAAIQLVEDTFKNSIQINFRLDGKVRDGDLKGHEFFGFLDGISQPALSGLVKPHTGQLSCDAGVIIHGTPGDSPVTPRPKWTLGGTVMAFRQLQQFVFEWDQFVKEHAIDLPGDKPGEGAHRRGAKMFGRWMSGCPVDLSPDHDDPQIGSNPEENNHFDYGKGANLTRCPITAHTRKMAPRVHPVLTPKQLEGDLIMRGSIPYGEEIGDEESRGEVAEKDRGLLFASYQSALGAGFKFIQERWANKVSFPFGYKDPKTLLPMKEPGFDPVIGAAEGANRSRFTEGEDPGNLTGRLDMPRDFIKARGGEYFWVPGMVAIDMIVSNQPMNSN